MLLQILNICSKIRLTNEYFGQNVASRLIYIVSLVLNVACESGFLNCNGIIDIFKRE